MVSAALRWFGLIVAPPRIGVPLVIGRPGSGDVTLTSPVIRVLVIDAGFLVQTECSNRYFVGNTGNTYRFPDPPDSDRRDDANPTGPRIVRAATQGAR